MGDLASAKQRAFPELIDGRYQVEKVLGHGGTAIVYQVRDSISDRQIALKQLLVKEEVFDKKDVTALFEQEFHILAQLAHPRVIAVYDFGKSADGPYYTMERLDGGDIRELAPLPWKRACSLFIDVCSVLALLHSRRLLHRDLSPRNVRCTLDFKAKLIDFGAMTPMGPCKRLIGTPVFVAPEVVSLQTIDARADLYSLGATLYYALTARTAYRCGTFSELSNAWRTKPAPPSSIVADIPHELDELVLSLMSLDVMARPVNAAEVIEKLSAIAGIEIDDKLIASYAYLSKPALVGRDEQLIPVRKLAQQAQGGSGGALLIDGNPGVGRSRFLEACMLEGRLVGATVLRADASDSYGGDWGVIKTLALQLIDSLPEIALELAKPYVRLLEQILPDIASRLESLRSDGLNRISPDAREASLQSQTSSYSVDADVWGRGDSFRPSVNHAGRSSASLQVTMSPQELRPRLQAALRDWWLEVSRRRCLVIAVDDIHRVDEPSAAFLALFSQDIAKTKWVLAVTAVRDVEAVSPMAIRLIKQLSAKIRLANLDLEHTQELMRSIFGEAMNIRLIASSIHLISRGNPRGVMQLLQHLVDKNLVRYQAGAWSLPESIDAGDLPRSLNEALMARVGRLSTEALHLAQSMALNPDQRFSYEDCLLLTEHRQVGRLIQNLDELVTADILATDNLTYWLNNQTWGPVLFESIAESDRRSIHLRVAEMFERRGNDQFRVAQHLLDGGQHERALDEFLRFCETTKILTKTNPEAYSEVVRALPKDCIGSLDRAVGVAQKYGRPRKQTFALLSRISGIITSFRFKDTSGVSELLKQLSRDTGLTAFYDLGDAVAFKERIGAAFKIAQELYDSSAESERVLAPREALVALATALVEISGVAYMADDFAFWRSLPSIKPFGAVSPALAVLDQVVNAVGDGIKGRIEQNFRRDVEILERIAAPDHAQFEGSHLLYLRYGVTHGLGIISAHMGLEFAMKCVSDIESSPLLVVNAWRIRKLYHLWQGASGEVVKCQERIELLQLENKPTGLYRGSALCPELRAYCLSDDLSGIRQIINDVEAMADEFPAWAPALYYARGEYQRIRGDHRRALKELRKALELAAPGRNQNWAYIANAYLATLNALGEYSRVEAEGRELVRAAQEETLEFGVNFIRMPLAVAQANLGRAADAVASADAAIDSFKGFGTTGLSLGLAYETRARVAILVNDEQAYRLNATQCAQQNREKSNPALSAKYEKLAQEGRRAKFGVPAAIADTVDIAKLPESAMTTRAMSILAACINPRERAEQILELLIKLTDSVGGFLYTLQKDGPKLFARDGQAASPPEMDALVRERLSEEIDDARDITQESAIDGVSFVDSSDFASRLGRGYHSVLLGHYTSKGYALTGIAILITDSDKVLTVPAKAIKLFSNLLLESGDVAAVYAAR